MNPLLAFKEKKTKALKDDQSSEEWSDDDKYDPKMTKEEKRAEREAKRKLLGKKRRAGLQGDIDEVKDFFTNAAPEEVPVNDMELQAKKDADKELERKALVDLFDVRFMPLNFTPDEFQDE